MRSFTPMLKHRRLVALACGLAVLALSSAFAASPRPAPCKNQSPRRLERWNTVNAPATVAKGATDDTLVYTEHGKEPETLHQCSQHYHCWIENLEPLCRGQRATEHGGPPGACPKPLEQPVGSWVEVHTVYSAGVAPHCEHPETLECCTKGPFVVMGSHAKVTADRTPAPIQVQWGTPAAEWTGSNTGADDETGCKPIEAQWRFRLDCGLTVSLGQLNEFTHPDKARGLQPAARLSRDLNHITH